MPDQLGRLTIPSPERSTAPTLALPVGAAITLAHAQFPLLTDYPAGLTQEIAVISHRFGSLATLATQRYEVAVGNRRFQFSRSALSFTERAALLDFYDSTQGGFKSFTYAAPNLDRTTFEIVRCIFDSPPLSITDLASMCRTGFTLVECPDSTDCPSYSHVGDPLTRFPSPLLSTALLSQIQRFIPLVTIVARDPAVPPIHLSDRRVIVDNQLYLPRLLSVGDSGSDAIFSQSISGASDSVSFVFGNADRAMSALNRDTGLKFASISLSLFHVQTSTLLNLWKGIITSFQIDGSPEFRVQCSDGLYPITQSYPRRVISRQCWKTFNDDLNCPWRTRGSGGNPSSCDYFFNSPNGCLSHGMSPFFGGHPSSTQSVVIHDEGTGHLSIGWSGWMALSPLFGGLQRATDKVTSTSIVADGLNGTPLPEYWCNSFGDPKRALWATAKMVSTRDESTFQDSLAIVGAGPLGGYEPVSVQTNADGFKFLVAPLVDGFPSQGFKLSSQLDFRDGGYHPELGLRQIFGTDPADPTTDAFSLGHGQGTQSWEVPDPVFSNILNGTPNNVIPLAAGTAFVEMRISKDPAHGLTPSTPESHSMTVPIKIGLTGVLYDPNGNRAFTAGSTNPFWVAVSTYLRALGLDKADEATQLSTFVLDSLTNNDSTGCAQIADLQVTPVIGDQSTLETQFQFQGVLAEPKPYRDWLTEILACALGYFTFEFGKLRLGIRENARDTSTFTLGNMLYQSLSLTPAEAAFEYLKIDFANLDLQGQQDTVEYNDKDHARYFGRADSPLSTRQRIVGLPFLSQGLRLVATRVREEIGGILRPDHAANPYVEWDNNFIVTFKSTLLALEVGIGDVISVTHPDIPTYPGPVPGSPGSDTYIPQPPNTWNFRITKLTVHKDYSVTITAKSVTDSMYDLDVGPKPAEVLPRPLPALFYAIPRNPVWAPHQVHADPADALFPGEWTFDTDQEYAPLQDGSSSAAVIVTGKLPVTAFAPGVGSPIIDSISDPDTGGVLPDATAWLITVVAFTSATAPAVPLPSPPAKIAVSQITSASDTGSISLTDIRWPKVTGLSSYAVYLSDSAHNDLICLQSSGALTPTGDGTTYSPDSLTITGPIERSTYALPSPFVSLVRVKIKLLIHSGVAGVAVDEVGGIGLDANTIICVQLIDPDGDPSAPGEFFDPTGRVLSVLARASGPTPWASFLITVFNRLTGALTLDRNPVGIIAPGDAVAIRFLGYDNSASPTTFTDPGLRNVRNGYGGFNTDPDVGNIEPGNLWRVISGLGRGEIRKITSATPTSISWDLPLLMDSTSVGIIEAPNYSYQSDSTAIDNANPDKAVSFTIPVDNYPVQPVLLVGFTVDISGTESGDGDGPIREDWIFGDSSLIEVDRATFGVGIGAPQPIGDDLTNHFMVRQPNFGGMFIEALANCKTPMPSGVLPLNFDIEKSTDQGSTWHTVFGATKLVIPPNSTLQVHQNVFALAPNNSVVPGDWLRVNLLAGSNEGSADIEIVIRWGKPRTAAG